MVRHPLFKLCVTGSAVAVLALLSYFNLRQMNQSDIGACDVVSGACQVVSGFKLSFSDAIEVNKPLTLTLTVPEATPVLKKRLMATLTGRDMYMGITEAALVQQQQGRAFVGTMRIPICTTEKMDWQLEISSPNDDVAPLIYQFSSIKQ